MILKFPSAPANRNLCLDYSPIVVGAVLHASTHIYVILVQKAMLSLPSRLI